MTDTDTVISPIVDRIVEVISAVPDIGLVYPHDIWDRDDITDQLVSDIAGAKTMRAWWVAGPQIVSSAWFTFGPSVSWTMAFDIYGVEGLAGADDSRGSGGDILTLRANAMALTKALDADTTLRSLALQTWPCTWPEMPEHKVLILARAVGGHVRMQKRLMVVTPS